MKKNEPKKQAQGPTPVKTPPPAKPDMGQQAKVPGSTKR